MTSKGEKFPEFNWDEYQRSKAGQLEDALNHINNLLINPAYDEEISADAATAAKEKFLHQLESLKSLPDYQSVTQATLNQVRDEADTVDWQDRQALERLLKFVRDLLPSPA